MHLICTSYCLLLRVFDQDDEIGDPQGLTVVTTLVKWNLKADAKKDVCSSLAPLGAYTQWGQMNFEGILKKMKYF